MRCFVLWTENRTGKVSHDPTVFTSAAAVIAEGERQKDKGTIRDYNFSVVDCPQISGQQPKIKLLTGGAQPHSIEL